MVPTAKRRTPIVISTLALATISSVFPGFLFGALSQQIGAEFAVSTTTYGWGVGAFFLAAMTGSAVLGRTGQKVGARTQISVALTVSALAQISIGLFARSFTMIVVFLAVAGFANSANQSAVNIALTTAKLPRLGVALAIKQSSMPAASMFAGFAVPAISLTVGWRWAYGLGSLATIAAIVCIVRVVEAQPRASVGSPQPATPTSTLPDLVLATVTVMLMAFAAGALNGWTVSSAVDAGLGEGAAGLLLSAGAVCGITSRLITGFRLDRNPMPFQTAALLTAVGACGILFMSTRVSTAHTVATLVAFGAGWVWPVPTNYGIIRSNEKAPGAATGFTQTGVYIGVASGAPVGGFLIERFGYNTMWFAVGTTSALGAGLAWMIRRRFSNQLDTVTPPVLQAT